MAGIQAATVKPADIEPSEVAALRDLVGDSEDQEASDTIVRRILADWAYVQETPFWAVDPNATVHFDQWGAGGDLLLHLATHYRNQVHLKASGQDLALEQKAIAAERQAATFASKALPRAADLDRQDTWF